MAHEFTMSAKFPGTCTNCKYRIEKGTWIIYDPSSKKARHKDCPEPDYSGAEQRNVFDMWIKTVEQADREAEERMNIPPSPHLSQPDEDME